MQKSHNVAVNRTPTLQNKEIEMIKKLLKKRKTFLLEKRRKQ